MLAQIALPRFDKGWVWLAGAGPGDPSLMTLQLYDALQKADCVVYDSLVSDAIVDLLPRGVERVFAGKRGGKPSFAQRDITEILILRARAEQRVLRLKGGDPFFFARGGEEALSLVSARVPFRVLPGLSSAPAALAYAGIPITHRDCNSSVTFLTGHDMRGGLPHKINWKALAASAEVLVFYMALRKIDEICRRLLQGGRSPDEPIALIRNATLTDEEVRVSTLGQGAEAARSLSPPVIFVVGKVVAMRSLLDWRKNTASLALEAASTLSDKEAL